MSLSLIFDYGKTDSSEGNGDGIEGGDEFPITVYIQSIKKGCIQAPIRTAN